AAGLLERAYRWARRNPSRAAVVVLGGAVAVLTAVGLLLGHALTEASRARQQAEAANASLTDAKAALEKGLDGETRALGTERALKGKVEAALGGERAAKAQLEAAQLEIVRQGYFRSVDLAHRAHLDGEPARAAAILDQCPRELRDWEWAHV